MAADVTTADDVTVEPTATVQLNAEAPAVPPFLEALPPDLQAEPSLKGFKDVADLAKSWVATKKMVGERYGVPKPDAPPEVHAKFRAELGVPDSPDKYGVQLPALPEGLGGWDQAKINHALAKFHAAGYTPAQVNDAIGLYAEMLVEAHDAKLAADAKSVRDAEAALAKKWGAPSGPTFRRNLGLAQKALDAFLPGDNPLRAVIEGKGNDPHLVEFLALAGERMLEDGAIDAAEYESMTQDAVQAKIDAMRADKTNPLNDPNHPGHQAALDQYLELLRKLPGGREPILTIG